MEDSPIHSRADILKSCAGPLDSALWPRRPITSPLLSFLTPPHSFCPATQVPSLLFKSYKCPTSGPLHWWLLPPGAFFSLICTRLSAFFPPPQCVLHIPVPALYHFPYSLSLLHFSSPHLPRIVCVWILQNLPHPPECQLHESRACHLDCSPLYPNACLQHGWAHSWH